MAKDATATVPAVEVAAVVAEGEALVAAVEEAPPSLATPGAVGSVTAATAMADAEADTVPMLPHPPGP